MSTECFIHPKNQHTIYTLAISISCVHSKAIDHHQKALYDHHVQFATDIDRSHILTGTFDVWEMFA